MKKLILLILIALLFSSCATRYCQPSKGSRDYAKADTGKKHSIWRHYNYSLSH